MALTTYTRTIAGTSSTSSAYADDYVGNLTIAGTKPWVDVTAAAYGATGNGSTNDTAAIQLAITAAKTVATGDGVLYFPPGTYLVDSLNFTGIDGMIVMGAGHQSTRIMPNSSSVHVFDCVGSAGMTFRDFQVGAFNQTPVPTTAFLLAASGSVSPDRMHFENLYVTGKYSSATAYIYGLSSSDMVNCDWYNYQSAAVPTLYLTNTNADSLSSTNATIATGTQATSDWTLTGCEAHDMTSNANGLAIRLRGIGSFRYLGGNVSQGMNAGNQYIRTDGACQEIAFLGTTFYSDTGPDGPLYVVNVVTTTMTSLSLINCSITGTSAVFAGDAGITYDKLFFFGKVPVFTNVIGNGNAITVTDGFATCDGAQINVSTGTLTRGFYINPGTVTATTNTATRIGSAGGFGFYGSAPVAKQTSGANLTNSVTSGGTDDTIADFSDLTVYANSAAAIRNNQYQLARKLKQVNDALRLYGLLT